MVHIVYTLITLTICLTSTRAAKSGKMTTKIFTVPTGTGRILGPNGTIYIPCNECFGVGVKTNPTVDPLCWQGCGVFKVYTTAGPTRVALAMARMMRRDDNLHSDETRSSKKFNFDFVYVGVGALVLIIVASICIVVERKLGRRTISSKPDDESLSVIKSV